MTKTMKEIADKLEDRYNQDGYSEGQKRSIRNWKRFVINPEEPKTYVNKEIFTTRIELDRVVDELNEQRALREVWDE